MTRLGMLCNHATLLLQDDGDGNKESAQLDPSRFQWVWQEMDQIYHFPDGDENFDDSDDDADNQQGNPHLYPEFATIPASTPELVEPPDRRRLPYGAFAPAQTPPLRADAAGAAQADAAAEGSARGMGLHDDA